MAIWKGQEVYVALYFQEGLKEFRTWRTAGSSHPPSSIKGKHHVAKSIYEEECRRRGGGEVIEKGKDAEGGKFISRKGINDSSIPRREEIINEREGQRGRRVFPPNGGSSVPREIEKERESGRGGTQHASGKVGKLDCSPHQEK